MNKLSKTQHNVNYAACKPKLLLLALASLLAPMTAIAEDQVTAQPKRLYEQSQTFKGQSFFKDTNIWVYNANFAEYFGMPEAGIESKIKKH